MLKRYVCSSKSLQLTSDVFGECKAHSMNLLHLGTPIIAAKNPNHCEFQIKRFHPHTVSIGVV